MIGIIILNYINWEVTERCIKSIYTTTKNTNYHIYLVDNASPNLPTNQILELITHKNITFIKNVENKGYSAGNNVGIKESIKDGCEAILIANSDIIFLDDSIDILFNYLQNNVNVGIIGPKLISPDGKIDSLSMVIKTGLKEKYLVRTALRKIFKSKANEYCGKDKDLNKPVFVHSVSGACFMMSRECALDITPFDENTFLYEEELIIGINMEEKEYKTLYYPGASVIHAHGQSTKNVKAFSFICFVESEIYYCKKYLNSGVMKILPLYMIRTMSYLVRCFRYKDFRKNIIKYFRKTCFSLFNTN